ncbi:hypothetical protein [Thalassobaculum sp.]|uniref:hypothetical protein n=1 Tax=Thalassobaculum sp. TaxID=2022740 RepID=UPI0032EFB7A9
MVMFAHNAEFDRIFAERLDPVFATKTRACSLSELPRRDAGIGNAVAMGSGAALTAAVSIASISLAAIRQPSPGGSGGWRGFSPRHEYVE